MRRRTPEVDIFGIRDVIYCLIAQYMYLNTFKFSLAFGIHLKWVYNYVSKMSENNFALLVRRKSTIVCGASGFANSGKISVGAQGKTYK